MALKKIATVEFKGLVKTIKGISELTKKLAGYETQLSKLKKGDPGFQKTSQALAAVEQEIDDLSKGQVVLVQAFEKQKQVPSTYKEIKTSIDGLTKSNDKLLTSIKNVNKEYAKIKTSINTTIRRKRAFNKVLEATFPLVKKFGTDSVRAFGNAAKKIKDAARFLFNFKSSLKKLDPDLVKLKTRVKEAEKELEALKNQQKGVNKEGKKTEAVAGSYNKLKDKTKELTAEFKKLTVGVNTTQKGYDNLAEKIQKNNKQITAVNRNLRGSKSIADRFKEGMVGAFKSIALQIGVAAVALKGFQELKDIGKLGLDIERGFAQVNTVAQLSQEELAKLKTEVLEVARTSTAELSEVPIALFEIVSATGDVALSQDILEKSLKAAKVGFTDVTTAAKAGVNIYNATKSQVADIAEVFDVLFRTQKEGVINFQQLAAEIPRIIPSANKAGVSFKQTAAALATLTKAGVDATQASTLLDRTLIKISEPATQANFKKLGISLFNAKGETRDLTDIFGQLGEKIKGLDSESKGDFLSRLGLDARASKGVGILTDNIETLREVTQSIDVESTEGIGEMARQFQASANSADELKIASNDLQVELLDKLTPVYLALTQGALGFFKAIASGIKFLGENRKLVVALFGVLAALNAQRIINTVLLIANTTARIANNLVGGKGTLIARALTVATSLLSGKISIASAKTWLQVVAQRALNVAMKAAPIGILVAGVTALALGIFSAGKNTGVFTKNVKELNKEQDKLTEHFEAAKKSIGEQLAGSESLFRALRKENVSREDKRRITDEIISQYGSLLSNMEKEKLKAGEVEQAYLRVRDAIVKKVIAEKQQEAIVDLLSKDLDTQLDIADEVGKLTGKTANQVLGLATALKDLPSKPIAPVPFFDEGGQPIPISDAEQALFRKRLKEYKDGLTEAQIAAIKFRTELESATAGQGVFISIETRTLNPATGEFNLDQTKAQRETTRRALRTPEQASLEDFDNLQDKIVETDGKFQLIEDRFGTLALASKTNVISSIDDFNNLGGSSDDAKSKAEKLAKAIAENFKDLHDLQKNLTDIRNKNVDDETAREIRTEDARFSQKLQLTIKKTAEILEAEVTTKEQSAEAIALQDAIIEELTINHYGRLNNIQAKAIKKEEDFTKKKAEDEKKKLKETQDGQRKILDLRIDTIEKEISINEKKTAVIIRLLDQEKEARIKILEFETRIALASAKTEEEKTELLRNMAAKRAEILFKFQNDVDAAQKDRGPILSRILGISEEELEEFKQVFDGFLTTANSAIESFFSSRIEALDSQMERVLERIQTATERVEFQMQRVAALEEELDNATGARRQRLIALIDKERAKEKVLHDQKLKQEKEQIRIEKEKEKLIRQQNEAGQIQAISSAVVNTAVSITKAIAEVPFPASAVLVGLYTALGAAQVALIAGQKFAEGGPIGGSSHADGGTPVWITDANQLVEAEKGEYIVRKSAVENNRSGIERINSEGAFTKFDVVPAGYFPNTPKAESGGELIGADFVTLSSVVDTTPTDALALQALTLQGIRNLENKTPVVSVQEIDRVRGQVRVIQEEASINL